MAKETTAPPQHGSFLTVRPSDVVQAWSRSGQSGLLRVECSLGTGLLWLREGAVIDCRLGPLSGVAAIHCILGQRSGKFVFQVGPVDRPAGVSESTQKLLTVHQQHAKEWEDIAAQLPPAGTVLRLNKERAASEQGALNAEEKWLLSLLGRQRPIFDLVDRSGLEPLATLKHIVGFLDLNLVHVVDDPHVRAGSTAPPPAVPMPQAAERVADGGNVGVRPQGMRVVSGGPAASSVPQATHTSGTTLPVIDVGTPRHTPPAPKLGSASDVPVLSEAQSVARTFDAMSSGLPRNVPETPPAPKPEERTASTSWPPTRTATVTGMPAMGDVNKAPSDQAPSKKTMLGVPSIGPMSGPLTPRVPQLAVDTSVAPEPSESVPRTDPPRSGRLDSRTREMPVAGQPLHQQLTPRLDSIGPVEAGAQRPKIGRYDVLSRLGRGGMGTVYLVRLTGAGGFARLFAMKVLRAHLAFDEKAVGSLLAEGRIAARLMHANVVGVLDVGHHGRQPYVVMDYIHGVSLSDLLAVDHEQSSARCIVAILLDALAGLGAVHTATDVDGTPLPMIHHDVSSHNFLVGIDGVCRLTDFGLAGLYYQDKMPANRGKPGYMSPERVRGTPIDARSDIFSLGVMMWTALAGAPLFETEDPQTTLENVLNLPVPPPSHVSQSPQCLDAICLRALERAPKNRYQSAQMMYDDLRRVAMQNDLLGAPSEVSDWVRSYMGSAADIVFDDAEGRPGSRMVSPLASASPLEEEEERVKRSASAPLILIAKIVAVIIAIGALAAVVVLANLSQ